MIDEVNKGCSGLGLNTPHKIIEICGMAMAALRSCTGGIKILISIREDDEFCVCVHNWL